MRMVVKFSNKQGAVLKLSARPHSTHNSVKVIRAVDEMRAPAISPNLRFSGGYIPPEMHNCGCLDKRAIIDNSFISRTQSGALTRCGG
jgi:hypothetical protein